MPVYKIGNTEIEYELERKGDIERRYIEVMPGRVLVTVSDQDNDHAVEGFLRRKERWLFDNTQRVNKRASKGHSVHRFVTGVKIPYRGRRMKLTITRKTTPDVEVSFRNGFIVALTDYVTDDVQDAIVEDALKFWLKRQVKDDIHQIVNRYARKHGFCPKGVRVKDQKHLWGSCSKDGTVNLNWHLVYAPKAVLEYAVLHELCHLEHRTHGPEFWGLIEKIMPDYEDRKVWLEQNEHMTILTSKIL
jgi:predicted metal-dependent hydrolase